MYKEIQVEIEGVAALMLNNIRKANPTDSITKEIKKITSKRTKTDADFVLVRNLEWLGALYTTKDADFKIVGSELELGDFGHVCINGDMLEACIIGGAKKNKLGVQFKAGMLVYDKYELDFPNKKPAQELYGKPEFVDTRSAKLQGKTTIFVTRAIFHEWSLKFTINYLPDLINLTQIETALEASGSVVGIGTYRPKFGRFDVKSIN